MQHDNRCTWKHWLGTSHAQAAYTSGQLKPVLVPPDYFRDRDMDNDVVPFAASYLRLAGLSWMFLSRLPPSPSQPRGKHYVTGIFCSSGWSQRSYRNHCCSPPSLDPAPFYQFDSMFSFCYVSPYFPSTRIPETRRHFFCHCYPFGTGHPVPRE